MMIDITKFFIISQNQFDMILSFLNCELLTTDKEYVITYLFANFLAYFFIIFVLATSLKIFRKLKRDTYNAKLI